MRLAALACLLASAAAGCVGGDEDVRTLARGSHSAIHDALRVVVTDGAEWSKLWSGHVSGVADAPGRPDVDFGKERVVAIFLGPKPDSCWSVEITSAKTDRVAEETTVRFTEKRNGGSCDAAVTYPHHLVAIPTAGTQVVFEAS